jgi:dTDP-4-dehydrorhamnose reductase
MPSYLLTGAGGQLGQCFQAVSTQFPQHQLICTTREEADLNRPETLEKIYAATPFEGILNCAAYTQVDKAETEKDKATAINEEGVANLIDFALPRQLKIIHFSTDFVFDGHQKSPYKETDSPHPLNSYGQSKVKGEQLLIQAKLPSVIIRTSWLFSPYGSNFVKSILFKAKRGEELKVVSDQYGTPTAGLDLAQAVLRILDHPALFEAPIYHIAQGPPTSWYGFAQQIVALSGSKAALRPILSEDYPTAARRPHYAALDTQRIQKNVSLSLRNWEDALADCLQLIQANEGL